MYEFFEHTADIGLRARAAELDTLFADAAAALFAVMVTNFDAVRPVQQLSFELEEDCLDDLLHDWLAELLYTFHTRRVLLKEFQVRLSGDDTRLTAVARGEPVDLARHQLDVEVKAITYHGLKVERQSSGWLAEVIVDI
jgi:SHS2 domain-containing protein